MSKATNAQDFIAELAIAFHGSGDTVKLDELFADDLVYSVTVSTAHHSSNQKTYRVLRLTDKVLPTTVGMNKQGWLNHCANYYAKVYNMRVKTFNVFGDINDLIGWEYRFTFTSKKDNPKMGAREGEDITIRGMSIYKLRTSEKGLQIVEGRDYYSFLHKED